jgi:hypothetical protein
MSTSCNLDFIETTEIDKKVQTILRQTDYTDLQAIEKLKEFHYNEIEVIRSYFGISEKKTKPKIQSINQEIYRQIRTKLDSNMKDYNIRVEKGEAKKM